MGGNQGFVSFAIAEAFPKLKFVVQDTEGMRKPEAMGSMPAHLEERVTRTVHDFFEPQTVVADVYFFRWIFHGFSDKYKIKILRALRPALRKGAKAVINDGTLPEPLTASYLQERNIRTMDAFNQITVNAREREIDDWSELFRLADERYKFTGAWKPEKATCGLLRRNGPDNVYIFFNHPNTSLHKSKAKSRGSGQRRESGDVQR